MASRLRLTPSSRRHLAEAGAVAVATTHNWLSNRRLPASVYVPVNVVVAAGLIGLGRWGGASWADLGLERRQAGDGFLAGAALGGVTVLAVSQAAARPQLQHWFADERVINLTRRDAVYQALIRIPVGTALAEELTFRGALTGLSLRQRSWPATVAFTSALFGLWHVLPVIDTLAKHPLGKVALEAGRPNAAVATGVVGTGLAGVGFSLLRWATGSVVAPAVLHAMVNVSGFAAARILHARRNRQAIGAIRPRRGTEFIGGHDTR